MSDPIPNQLANGGVGKALQFYDPLDPDFSMIPVHQRLEGCETAALNGLDCTNCGCDCEDPPVDIDCVQEGPVCGNCSELVGVPCDTSSFVTCSYNTTVQAEGLGQSCLEDYQMPCDIVACPVDPITEPPTTTTVPLVVDCTADYIVDGVNVLDVEFDSLAGLVNLGGNCASAADYAYCQDIVALGADCWDSCSCVCDPAFECNSRPFPGSEEGKCYSRTKCADPCTGYIARPDLEGLDFTCQQLLETMTMQQVQDLFDLNGVNNYCDTFMCCTDYDNNGGIPIDGDGNPVYQCYETTTRTTTTTASTTTTTPYDECNEIIAEGTGGDFFTANDLISRNLSCYQIANAIAGIYSPGGTFSSSNTGVISNLTYYPERANGVEELAIAHRCGCEDRCVDKCAGCNALDEALEAAGFDDRMYYCSDIERDFNMDCRACGCLNEDECDDAVLSSSGISKNTDSSLYDISCNQLNDLGLNCFEIAAYTDLHGKNGTCDYCNCSLTTSAPFCEIPCGGGQFGGNSSSGVMGTEQLLSCNDLIDADFTCEQATVAGCTGCEVCGCENEEIEVQTCESECNDLGLSCDDLVEDFTCSDLNHPVFDGCDCGSCGCVEEFTEVTCPSSCLEGKSCDYWIEEVTPSDRNHYTCDNLKDQYGCDCTGCRCLEFNTTTAEPTDCSSTTTCLDMDCQTVSEMSGIGYYELEETYGCDCVGCPGCDPTGCEGVSCDEFAAMVSAEDAYVSCDALETQLGCSCSGCDCVTTDAPATPEPAACNMPCSGLATFLGMNEDQTCDDIREMEGTMTCAYMETFFACDCSGCLCEEVEGGCA